MAILFLSGLGVNAQSDEYTLEPADKLRIRVVEWQSASGAVRDWSSISGDYVVNPSGNLSLPFIGEFSAAGKTTATVASEIGQSLQEKFGLVDRPEASVEIAEFRPIFVSGAVETPGEYPYSPGLTVLKAVSLAGGLRRSSELGQRFERDFINARGNFEVQISERNQLIARRARLLAEANGSQNITLPSELRDAPGYKALLADEMALKEARERRLRTRLDAIDDLRKLLQSEITSLNEKIATQNRQIELAREELNGIGKLAERGLVVNSRVLTLERTIADLQGKVLDMETASLRAKQDISKAARDAADLQSERDTEIAQQRQQTEAEIDRLNLKIDMYRDLMAEALANAPEVAAASLEDQEAAAKYAIVRMVEGEPRETIADENTRVIPGDVIKVAVTPLPIQQEPASPPEIQ